MTLTQMKAISFRQPWADLILSGKKTLEVRSWKDAYRGTILVHVSKNVDRADLDRLGVELGPIGVFLGTVQIIDMFQFDEESWLSSHSRHLTDGDLHSKRDRNGVVQADYGWVLANPKRFDQPLPASGKLGFFNPPSEAIQMALA